MSAVNRLVFSPTAEDPSSPTTDPSSGGAGPRARRGRQGDEEVKRNGGRERLGRRDGETVDGGCHREGLRERLRAPTAEGFNGRPRLVAVARGCIVAPIQIYPIFESAIRAASGRSVDEHNQHLGKLWSNFSKVAVANPYAWIRKSMTPEEIITTGPRNRMIGLPYTKVMNSNNDVDQSAAIIMCSVAAAERMGISKDKWVFPIAGTDCHEHRYVSERDTFADTPAVKLGGKMALDLAETSINDIDIVDLYSCFPSAVQLGAASLGLSTDRQLTRTGGLSFAGGPWNNYVMHAVATVIGELRARPGEKGLVWGNGGYATKHAFGVYSTTPPTNGFKHAYPQDQIDALPRRTVVDIGTSEGPATIEGYTVMHDRDGNPERAIAPCLLPNGNRAWGISDDADTVKAMCEGEWVGRAVRLDATGTLLIK